MLERRLRREDKMAESFKQRLGLNTGSLIINDFSSSARIAFAYVLEDLADKRYIELNYDNFYKTKWSYVNRELERICRIDSSDKNDGSISSLLKTMEWQNVFVFIERVYSKLLTKCETMDTDSGRVYVDKELSDVKDYFTEELSTLLSEENIGYEFENGIFQRKGYIKTEQAILNAKKVLSDPSLIESRRHYNKALEYFRDKEKYDYENSVKESICAIESCLAILFSNEITNNFEKGIRKLCGNDKKQVPAPIIESIIKVYGYRNNGNGVAHGTTTGLKVTEKETELVLALCGDYITYFYSLLKESDSEIPF
jgi:hypothetical protein